MSNSDLKTNRFDFDICAIPHMKVPSDAVIEP
jgi:hypothetical protein